MSKIKKTMSLALSISLLSTIVLSMGSISRVKASENDTQILKVYNWGDYIYDGTDPIYDDNGEPIKGIVEQFEEYYAQKHPGKKVQIDYQMFDTNEVMLNEIKTGKTQYDLICPSDYIIQKMMREDMLEKIDISKVPNYVQYASPYHQALFEANGWDEYSIGYMWGTVGLTYNPATVDEKDMESWQSLWSIDYNKKILIKDSMRETYLVGVMKVYRHELEDAKEQYEDGIITASQYNAIISDIFNRHDSNTLDKAEEALTVLKKNIYGFEVDSGKNDIATGKVDINLAWSGDAVYSMNTAEEDNDVELNFSVPLEGSNIWFDGWCLPKGANKELSYEFLDFLSKPSIAKLNMEYIGYTSFIAGDEMLDMVWDWYGDEEGEYSVDLSYFFNGTLSNEYDASRMVVKTDTLGRQFSAQYPDLETVTRCAVMEDYGNENENVVAMWERLKANDVPTWLIIVVCGIVIVLIGGGIYNKYNKSKARRRRRRLAYKK